MRFSIKSDRIMPKSIRGALMRSNLAVSEREMPLATGLDVRLASRSGTLDAQTAGMAPGYVQGNLAVLPHDCAEDFLRFCQANPKPCPLLGVSEPGDPAIAALGADLDTRPDVPRYRVWRDGTLVDEPRDITSVWRDDLVGFVLGCS